jgi:hypothetical protein
MSLLPLDNWDTTRTSLHKAAKLLGALRLIYLPHEPLYLELPLKVTSHGVGSGRLSSSLEIDLDFKYGAFHLTPSHNETSISFTLDGISQAQLFQSLVNWLRQRGHFDGVAGADAKIDVLLGKAQGDLPMSAADVNDTTPLRIERTHASAYADVLYAVFNGIARFRARLTGMMTPLVVYPHGFDLSMIWFAGNALDEAAPHISFGFSPGSGGLPFPYLYAYAHPAPEAAPRLPDSARWYTEGWTGVVVPYEELRRHVNVSEMVENTCQDIYRALLPHL